MCELIAVKFEVAQVIFDLRISIVALVSAMKLHITC